MKNYHLTFTRLGWKLKAEGEEYAEKIFRTDKETAIKECAALLKKWHENASLKIHKEDGTFQEERTYPRSADPVNSAG